MNPFTVAALALFAAGCSLSKTENADCVSNDQCRAAFGPLSVCASDGFCDMVAPRTRCDRGFPADLLTDAPAYADAVILGTLFDRSLATHQARERAVQLAVQQANDQGGIDGRAAGVVFCNIEENPDLDDLSRTDAAVEMAGYLARDIGVPAVVGPSASSDAQRVFQALDGSGVVIVSPAASSPALTGLDGLSPTDESPGLLWRTAPPDSLQGVVIASDIEARGSTNVAVIHEIGVYGEELARIFVMEFGGSSELLPFNSPETRDATVDTVAGDTYDEVLFISSQTSDIVAFLTRAAPLPGFADKRIFLTDAAANADVLTGAASAGSLFTRVRGTRPAVPSGFLYDQFVASYDLAFEEDVTQFSFTAHSYDAAWLTIYGAGWSHFQEGEISGLGIARGLRRVSSGTGFEIRASTLGPILQSFREGNSIDVTGASGPLDYDPATEETTGAIEVWVIDSTGMRIEVVNTIEPT